MKHMRTPFGTKKFFGSGRVGRKGQVVIPSEARKACRIKEGDRMLFVGSSGNTIVLVKADAVDRFIDKLLKNVGRIAKR